MEEDLLRRQLAELEQRNESLRAELGLFDAFIQRNPVLADQSEDEGKGDHGKGKRSRLKSRQKALLTLDQKCQVASKEVEALKKQMEDSAQNTEKLLETMRAILEETEIRITELKKEAYEFKRDIVIGAENYRTGKTMAEKVVRYMEDKLRVTDSVVEKLRLKNGSLKGQIAKLEAQLTQKEEMGDVLHYIDFHQQEIENKQHVATIEQRNDELIKLKMTTGRTVQVLNNLKRRLSELTSESEYLRSEISNRSELLRKISEEGRRVEGSIGKMRSQHATLRVQQEDTAGMPVVMDYVQQKAEMYELQNEVTQWERKLEIAMLGLKRANTLARGGGSAGKGLGASGLRPVTLPSITAHHQHGAAGGAMAR